MASDRVDAETYGAFNRAVREAVKRINADKAKYLHYFIDYHAKKDADIAALKPQDLRASRIVVCDPAPIPLDEMQRTYDWLKSWGMLEQTATPLALSISRSSSRRIRSRRSSAEASPRHSGRRTAAIRNPETDRYLGLWIPAHALRACPE